jgi:biopolymer transport protein ExbB
MEPKLYRNGLLILAVALLLGAFSASSSLAEPPVGNAAASIPTDPVGGGEIKVIAERNLFHIIRQGGPLMVPISICSVILFLFVFERFISLRHGRVIPKPFVKRFLHELREDVIDQDDALEMCARSESPVSQVFAGAIQKWGRPSVEVEQGIIDAGERATNGLRRYLRLINGVATITPLLGLLGTVVGMIQAFNDIATADAMGKPELLAAGIGQALITTASGLTVAIPALIFYMYFLSRVDRLVMDIDALAQSVVGEISAEALEKKKKGRKKVA